MKNQCNKELRNVSLLCVIQKEETEHCVHSWHFGRLVALPIKPWRNWGHGQIMANIEDFSTTDWWRERNLLWIFVFLCCFFSLGDQRVGGKTTSVSIFICGTKPEKCEDSQLMLERTECAFFFSCLRQIIFCKFTVTSVLFSVYYTDSKPTLKCNRRVPHHRIFTVRVRACAFLLAGMNVWMRRPMVTWMRQEGKILTRHILHLEDYHSCKCFLSISHVDPFPDTEIWMFPNQWSLLKVPFVKHVLDHNELTGFFCTYVGIMKVKQLDRKLSNRPNVTAYISHFVNVVKEVKKRKSHTAHFIANNQDLNQITEVQSSLSVLFTV